MGEKCQADKITDEMAAEKSGENDGGDGGAHGSDMARVFQALEKISGRLDKLEKGAGDQATVHGTTEPDVEIVDTAAAAAPVAQASDNNSTNLHDAGKTLNSLLKSPIVKTVHNAGAEKDKFDPRCMLTVKSRSTKAVHITQFLHEGAKRRRQNNGRNCVIVDTSENGDQLIFRSDDQHPYANISVSEWGAANCRLLNYLLQEGQIKRSDIEYYLAYTAKIHDLVEKYEWQSILAYDYEYRELQAEYAFNWGVSNPHLEINTLVPRQRGKTNPNYKQSNVKKEQGSTDDCKLWLAHGYCRFGDKCRYKHRPQETTPSAPPDSEKQ